MSAPGPMVDVEQVMREIRERVYRHAGAFGTSTAKTTELPTIDWTALRQAAQHAARCAGRIGQLPPAPLTFRARCGALCIRLVRRILFWYTPPIVQSQQAVARAIREQVDALERLAEILRLTTTALQGRIEQLERGHDGRTE